MMKNLLHSVQNQSAQKAIGISAVSLSVLLMATAAQAAVLPEDRVDTFYHNYSGGGVTIDGPAIMLRKKIGTSTSVSAHHLVDNVSGASIDVETTASEYSETRIEQSVGVDLLEDKTIMSLSYATSEEDDHSATALSLGVSQDFFGDLTSLAFGYTRGQDEIRRRGNATFAEDASSHKLRISLTQILTKNFLMNLGHEIITDQGYLNNPYRQVRFVDAGASLGYDYEFEVYPETRTSNATAIRGKLFLPYRAAWQNEYRFFSDSWGIEAHTFDTQYTHPIGEHWILDASVRFYSQEKADFYSDLFPFAQSQNFMARDKELSTFTTRSIGLGITWQYKANVDDLIKNTHISIMYDNIAFDYDDFSNLLSNPVVGAEPKYSFTADVVRVSGVFWF